MNMIKVKYSNEIPEDYTGVVRREDGTIFWFKGGKVHREDGPARIYNDVFKVWRLEGKFIWDSYKKLDLTNEIILSKTKHPEYPTVQVWRILDSGKVYEQIIIPGMEEYILE